jgi:hypothetical protein
VAYCKCCGDSIIQCEFGRKHLCRLSRPYNPHPPSTSLLCQGRIVHALRKQPRHLVRTRPLVVRIKGCRDLVLTDSQG